MPANRCLRKAKSEARKGITVKQTDGRAGRDDPEPEVVVRWQKLPGTPADEAEVALGIVETVTRFSQVSRTAPLLHAPLPLRDELVATAQTEEPLSFRLAAERIVGTQILD